jgi:hypothetical protein
VKEPSRSLGDAACMVSISYFGGDVSASNGQAPRSAPADLSNDGEDARTVMYMLYAHLRFSPARLFQLPAL